MAAGSDANDGPPQARYVSNSINFEDVLLHRLFGHRDEGFFVDVGAEHPRLGNDTFALYERGWRGINVEPNAAYFVLLEEERPRDRNLPVALSDVAAPHADFYEVQDTGLSTCDAAQAAAHAAAGLRVLKHVVPVDTLAAVLNAANPPPIDFLKVDVEGLEEQVLRGNDWSRFRPRIVLVEATLPNSPERRETGVEAFLAEHGYRRVHFDGLNDWYAEARFDPGKAFALPPNVFDGFIRREVLDLREHLTAKDTAARMAATDRDSLRAEADQLAKGFKETETYARSLEAERLSREGQISDLFAERDALQVALSSRTAEVRAVETVATALLDGSGLGVLRSRLRGPHPGQPDAPEAGVRPGPDGGGAVEIGPDANDVAERDMQDRDMRSDEGALADRLLAAQQAGLDAEIRRLGHRLDDLTQESRRLRDANAELRREVLELNRALDREAMPGRGRTAESEAQTRELEELRRDLQGARSEARDAARLLEAYRRSTSWRLTRPVRAVGRILGRGG